MSKKNIVHVVGTGTIGEPLIGLFTDFKEKWNIDEVTFHKRTPNANDRATVEHLINRGAKLVADEGAREEFARARASRVVHHRGGHRARDGRRRLHARREREQAEVLRADQAGRRASSRRAPSSASASRTRAASTTRCRVPDEPFVQVVSCNTHNISVLLKTLASHRREDEPRGGPLRLHAPRERRLATRRRSSPRRRRASTTIRNSARITPATPTTSSRPSARS